MDNQQLRQIINRYLSGEASKREQVLIDEWLRGAGRPAPDNAESEARRLVSLARLQAHIHQGNNTGVVRKMRWRRWMIAAAVLAPVALAAAWLYQYRLGAGRPVEMSFAAAASFSVREVVLPDSSVVVLNSLSSISYPQHFTGKKREVFLTGQAYFKVSARPEQPFSVHADSLTVKVLGTSFLVSNERGDSVASVGVTSGKVAVDYERDGFPEAILTPGRELQFYKHLGRISVINNARLETGWTTKRLIFEATPLADVLRGIGSSYYAVLHFDPEKLRGKAFTGSFGKNDALAEVLNVIALSYRLTIQQNKDGSLTIR